MMQDTQPQPQQCQLAAEDHPDQHGGGGEPRHPPPHQHHHQQHPHPEQQPAHTQQQQQQQQPSRVVHCCDALAWLRSQPPGGPLRDAAFITSLPDVSEFHATHGAVTPASVARWRQWFVGAARAVLDAAGSDEAPVIFFQTDILVSGVLVDKAHLLQQAAEGSGHELRWHSIVCGLPPGTPACSGSRAGYSHLLCFSHRSPSCSSAGIVPPSVLPDGGDKTWARGMGVNACAAACRYVLRATPCCRTVVDPFAGHGTVLAVANALGLDAVGVELSGSARGARGSCRRRSWAAEVAAEVIRAAWCCSSPSSSGRSGGRRRMSRSAVAGLLKVATLRVLLVLAAHIIDAHTRTHTRTHDQPHHTTPQHPALTR